MAEDATPPSVHRMRITQAGSMHAYISFALQHLRTVNSPPLVLHNLPSERSDGKEANVEAISRATTLALNKLVSLVELIKREYTKAVDVDIAKAKEAARTKKRKRSTDETTTPARKLYQYNELVCLEDLDLLPSVTKNVMDIVAGGKERPKRKHTPVLRVTLSMEELPDLAAQRDVTSQAANPDPPKARKRRKSKRKGAAKDSGTPAEEGVPGVAMEEDAAVGAS